MADDKKGPDEYQYPPEEYYKGGEYLPDENLEPLEPGEGPTGGGGSGGGKRILWLIGFVLAIVIVYLILSYLNTQRSADLSQPTPTEATASIPPTSQNNLQQVTPPPAPLAVENPATDAQIQRLTMQNQANQQTIAGLQSQIQQMQSQMSDLTNSLTTVGNQIQVLANEIRAIGIDRSVSGRSMALSSGIIYHVKALVPGRAWIESHHGRNARTVTIGDRLPGYGIVQTINPTQGIVTTSSGAVIEYGTNDS
jgi:hypothetical protein